MDAILSSADQLLGFFNNLLEESRHASGTAKLDNVVFAPDDLLRAVIAPVRILAEQKGLQLTAEIAADVPPTLHGDVRRLELVLLNLTSNAIKFTPQGKVTVQIFRPDPEHWAIAVSDTGRGIAPEDQKHIFEPFWQIDGSMTRDANRGVGLGLSIVERLTALEVENRADFVLVKPINYDEIAHLCSRRTHSLHPPPA